MFDDELEVFFDEDDFAARCTRSRSGVADVQFPGILASVDEALFEGQVTAGMHVLHYPTAAVDVQAQDVLTVIRTTELGTQLPAQVWRVIRSPERVVDGAESRVFLTPDPQA